MKFDLTTFGETMVRISVRPGASLAVANQADLYTGGTESNTAAALARLGMSTAWVSRLPDNPLGQRIAADVARHGVDTSHLIWTNKDRAGAYYVEFAPPPRGAAVTYDRQHSAVSKIKPSELDLAFLLNTRILHLTGITPALSASCRDCVALAIKKAREKRVPVSFDLNYRSKLWKPGAAKKTLLPMIENNVTLLPATPETETKQCSEDRPPEPADDHVLPPVPSSAGSPPDRLTELKAAVEAGRKAEGALVDMLTEKLAELCGELAELVAAYENMTGKTYVTDESKALGEKLCGPREHAAPQPDATALQQAQLAELLSAIKSLRTGR